MRAFRLNPKRLNYISVINWRHQNKYTTQTDNNKSGDKVCELKIDT